MDPITQQQALAAAGAGGDKLYVDDVFSTQLYTGTGNNQTITNEVDLSGEGGMVWIKARNDTKHGMIFDTERGVYKRVYTALTDAENTSASTLTSFNSDGFSIGNNLFLNDAPNKYASWTFRKAPGFFDVVTYTGTGSARTIAHNLGSVPGMIIVKRTDASALWAVYHRSTGNGNLLKLDENHAAGSTSTWNNTTPTSTHFSVNTQSWINASGGSYVAYIFAHDDQSFGTGGDESIIKCGSYTGNGSSTNGPIVDLGFEPQWLLIKNTTTADNWVLTDVWRDMTENSSLRLYPNTLDTDQTTSSGPAPLATGFQLYNNSGFWNTSGNTYVYIAIRRPHKPPTAATEVFDAYLGSANSLVNVGFPADLALAKNRSPGTLTYLGTRLQGSHYTLFPTNTNAEDESGSAERFTWDEQNKFLHNQGLGNCVAWVFKRASEFLDTVTYTGNGTAGATISHNLGATPEMIWVKRRDSAATWTCYHQALGNTHYIQLDTDSASTDDIGAWNDTDPTSSVFSVGTGSAVNTSSGDYLALLFGTVPGISKVGSYAGNGSSQTIDCGFTSGARWVMIKPYDTTGSWLVFDTERGINASSEDPYLRIDTNGTEGTFDDYIDPDSTGFELSSGSSAVNGSGNNYIFLAIA